MKEYLEIQLGDNRGKSGKHTYLEELDTDHSEHEYKENGDNDNVADTSQCHDYTRYHVLKFKKKMKK